MLTKEKIKLLKIWGNWYATTAGKDRSIKLTCFYCSMAGAFVAELPENHKLFAMPTHEALSVLSEMLEKEAGKLLNIV